MTEDPEVFRKKYKEERERKQLLSWKLWRIEHPMRDKNEIPRQNKQ